MTFITFLFFFLCKDRCVNVHFKGQDLIQMRQIYSIKPEGEKLFLNVSG